MSRSRRRSLRSAHAKKWVKMRAEAHHRRNHQEREESKELTKMATVKKSFARRFVLDRKEDVTGTSGTGVVAEGVMFSGGKVALHWFSHYGAVNVYDSIEVVRVLHGHGGNTSVVWLDEEMP